MAAKRKKGRTSRRTSRRRTSRRADARARTGIIGWNVTLRGRSIDKVFQKRDTRAFRTYAEQAEDIRRGLVDHDGYDPGIKVTPAR